MSRDYSTHLLEQLIRNKLSKKELDEFLASLNDDDARKAYSTYLETYFTNLLNQQNLKTNVENPSD